MVNHPEMNTNTLTQTIDVASMIILVREGIKDVCISEIVGASKLQKSAWTTSTRNIEIMRRTSIFVLRGPVDIELIVFSMLLSEYYG